MTPTYNVIGFVEEADYPRFRQVVSDPEAFPVSYAEWLKRYRNMLGQAKATGIPVLEVRLDPQELADWCAQQGAPVNIVMRGAFNAFKMSAVNDGRS